MGVTGVAKGSGVFAMNVPPWNVHREQMWALLLLCWLAGWLAILNIASLRTAPPVSWIWQWLWKCVLVMKTSLVFFEILSGNMAALQPRKTRYSLYLIITVSDSRLLFLAVVDYWLYKEQIKNLI